MASRRAARWTTMPPDCRGSTGARRRARPAPRPYGPWPWEASAPRAAQAGRRGRRPAGHPAARLRANQLPPAAFRRVLDGDAELGEAVAEPVGGREVAPGPGPLALL